MQHIGTIRVYPYKRQYIAIVRAEIADNKIVSKFFDGDYAARLWALEVSHNWFGPMKFTDKVIAGRYYHANIWADTPKAIRPTPSVNEWINGWQRWAAMQSGSKS